MKSFNVARLNEVVMPYGVLAGAKSMLRDDERRLLYYLARDVVPNDMAIVDAGSFTGGSTVALASGIADRRDHMELFRAIHSYDKFEVNSEFYKGLLFDQVDIGESFLPQFMHNIAPWHPYINVYPGDFLKAVWVRQPISLLFCDISKSPRLDLKIWRSFVPFLIPEKSFYLQQDFFQISTPYIHITLGEFEDYFDFEAIVESTLVLRLRREIDPANLDAGYRLSREGALEDQLERLNRVSRRIAPIANDEAKGTFALVRAMVAINHEDFDLASSIVSHVEEEFTGVDNPHFRSRIRNVSMRIKRVQESVG